MVRTDLAYKKKLFLPQYYDKNTYSWIDGKGGHWKPYQALKYTSDVILAVEGEGNVVASCSINVAAFTFRTYKVEEIEYALDFIDCSGIIVIADNDVVGLTKAKLAQECCWRKGIAANVIETKYLWKLVSDTECVKGADLKDIIELSNECSVSMIKSDVNMEYLINEYITNYV